VAEFVESRSRVHDALQSVFFLISQTSEEQAEWWRDHDILLPEVRKGIIEIIQKLGLMEELGRGIRGIKLRVMGSRPLITADPKIVEAVFESPDLRRRALARANAIVSAFGLQRLRIENAARSSSRVETSVKRARPSGIRLTELDASRVKAMLERRDRMHDIAAWFSVNSGRIAEVKSGERHASAPQASREELDPPGPPGRIARIALRALEDISQVLRESDGIERAHEIISRAFDDIRRVGE